jgi:hypothetical protein
LGHVSLLVCCVNSVSFTATWALRALSGLLLLGLDRCSYPLIPYAPTQLLPVFAGQPCESSCSLAGSRLYQSVDTDWDSVLVMLPYTPPAAVGALCLTNYGALRGPGSPRA